MEKYDVEKIKQSVLLSGFINNYVQLKPNGSEFSACCPFHKEKTPSFSVSDAKNFYYCFGCGAGGDVVDFAMNIHNCNFTEACKILGGEKETPVVEPTNRESKAPPDIYEGFQFQKTEGGPEVGKEFIVWNPKRDRWTTYNPSMVFDYGQFFVVRVEMPGGKKITPVLGFCSVPHTDKPIWTHVPAPVPRPLYWNDTGKQILLVEGEKAKDAAHRLVGKKLTVATWCGGGKAWKKTNWNLLNGRSVIIWPDGDEPGIQTANDIGGHLVDTEDCQVKIIKVKEDNDGWDAADAENEKWTGAKVIQWAKENAYSINETKIEAEPEHQPEPEPELSPPAPTGVKDRPYRILGFNDGQYHYLPDGTQQILSLSLSQHSQSYFLGLAPLTHWSENFGHGKKNDPNWQMVADSLLRASQKTGLFDPHELLRGRGAWVDGGRTIMHMGTNCYVDGKLLHPVDIDSGYIYQAMPDLGLKITKSLCTKEANKLVKLSSKLSWKNSLSGPLLAGWCVIAPLSGILKWRPHIWITGPSGSGKSTVVNDIVMATIGRTGIQLEGAATEAGIRQKLHQDARPVVFDEAEAEEAKDSDRIQRVLDLARISSSGGRVIKGGKDGKSQSFSIRSSFCFSSINTSVKHFADESRISKLILIQDKQDNSDEYYSQLEDEINNTFTPEYASALLSRSLKNMDVLQGNIDSFVKAATKVFKSRRIADQVGTMLAGTYLCYSTSSISPEEAEKWIKEKDWSDHTTINNKSDPQRLLDKICTHGLIVPTRALQLRPTIGELIVKASGGGDETDPITQDIANKELRKIGILCQDFDSVTISNNSNPLKKILQDTPWHSDWGRPLKELPDAVSTDNIFFSPGIKARATKIPIDLVRK